MAPQYPTQRSFQPPHAVEASLDRRAPQEHRGPQEHRAPQELGEDVASKVAVAKTLRESDLVAKRSLAARFFVALVALAIMTIAASAMGQDAAAEPAGGGGGEPGAFDVIPPLEVFNNEKVLKDTATGAMSFSRGNPQFNARAVQAYFTRYIPSVFTNPTQSVEMSQLVTDINTMIGRAASSRNDAIVNQLNDYLFRGLGPVASGNYYPPARVAAVTILGRLNTKPLDQQNKTAPVPFERSLAVIWPLVTSADEPDGVRAAALAGLHRYVMVSASISPQIAARVKEEMNKFMTDPRPADRDPNVHAYLQRFAVDILERLQQQNDPALGTQLISISVDESAPDLIALHSAGKLGAMSQALKEKVASPQKIADAWSRRLLRTLQIENERLLAYEKPKRARDQPREPAEFLDKRKTEEEKNARPSAGQYGPDMSDMMGGPDMSAMMEGMDGPDMSDMMDGMMMGPGVMMGPGGMMAMKPEAKPQPPEVIAARQKINHSLEQMSLGMVGDRSVGVPKTPAGLYAAVAEANRGPIEDWVAMAEELSTTLNDRELDSRKKFMDELLIQIESLSDRVPDEGAAVVDASLDIDDDLMVDELGGDELAPGKPAAADEFDDLDAGF